LSALGWETFGLTAVALFLKMLFVVLVQGHVRTRNNAYVPPEDAAYFGKGAAPVTEEATLVRRAQNVLRNDGENVPIFLFLAAAYVQLGCWGWGVLVYFPLFILSRVVHTVTHLWPRQPLRNRAYRVGLAVMLALRGHIVWSVVGR
jgi:uncharacterized membrane protein YecN with MAPEG domain